MVFLVVLLIGYPISSYSATERLFSQNVGLLVNTRLDPLVNPGTCSSHVHSVYGNANFAASITPDMLHDEDWRNTDGKYATTTSAFIPNLSMYWAPSLYILWEGLYHLVPSFARPYYRITIRGDGDASRVNAYPPFLRMIVGDASRKTAWLPWETDRDNIRWTLVDINRVTTNYLEHGDWTYLVDNPDLALVNQVEMKLQFPECLSVNEDGTPVTSSVNYRDHATYITGWDRNRKSYCPESHPYQIPKLDLEVRYDLDYIREIVPLDVVNDVGNWRLSTSDNSGAGGHADFVSGWPTELMENMIHNCTENTSRDNRTCYLDDFNFDSRDGDDKTVPYNGLVPDEEVGPIIPSLLMGPDCSLADTAVPSHSPSLSPTTSTTQEPETSSPSKPPSQSPITSSPTTSDPTVSPSQSPETSSPSKSPSQSPVTSSRPTTTQPTTNSCDSLVDWYFITSGGKTRRCGWVGKKLSRCNRMGSICGSDYEKDKVYAYEACIEQCAGYNP